MLCDHAQVAGDKLFISGGGIDRFHVPGPGPYQVGFGVAGTAAISPAEAAGDHVLAFRLTDADGMPAQFAGDAEGGTVTGELHITAGAGPAQDVQIVSYAFVFPTVPLARPGSYAVICTLDGAEVRRLRFEVVQA
jgi:hypothetical protein